MTAQAPGSRRRSKVLPERNPDTRNSPESRNPSTSPAASALAAGSWRRTRASTSSCATTPWGRSEKFHRALFEAFRASINQWLTIDSRVLTRVFQRCPRLASTRPFRTGTPGKHQAAFRSYAGRRQPAFPGAPCPAHRESRTLRMKRVRRAVLRCSPRCCINATDRSPLSLNGRTSLRIDPSFARLSPRFSLSREVSRNALRLRPGGNQGNPDRR